MRSGWFRESYRHSLAARGIHTKRFSRMAKVYRENIGVPDTVKAMSNTLKSSGATGVYAVGGYVRDKLLGREPKDLDIEVHGKTIDEVKDILERQGYKVDAVGKSFGVLKVKVGDEYIDVAVPRTDSSGRKPEVSFLDNPTPEEAARRRDITINAIMYDVNTGELVDPFGGISDLEKDNIKAVSSESFTEDPLRVLRAAQFASRFGFKVDADTEELARQVDASGMSGERIKDELEKALLKSEKPSVFFNELDRMGQLDKVFPEIAALKSVPNDTMFHPGEDTAYIHTMNVLDRAAAGGAGREVLLAAILHDTGKVSTSVEKGGGRVSAIGHENVSEEKAKEFFNRLKFDNQTSEDVTKAVKLHMKPHFLVTDAEKQNLKYINRLMVDFAGGVSNLRTNPEVAYARFRRAMELAKADKGHDAEKYDKMLQALPPLSHYKKKIDARPYLEKGLQGPEISEAINNTYLNEINTED